MNKNIMIAGIVIVVLILGLIGYMVLGKSKSTVPETTGPTPTQTSIFSSIKDALSRSISLECNFTDETGRQIKSQIKNGAVRADITSAKAEESGSVIVKDKTMWFWNSKSAFTMKLPDEALNVTVTPGQNQGVSQQQDIMNAMEKYKSSCHPSTVADSAFVPPADIKFQDLSQMMKLVPTGKSGVVPSINPTQIQEMMKQYQTTPSQ